jgi:hypothetical protein
MVNSAKIKVAYNAKSHLIKTYTLSLINDLRTNWCLHFIYFFVVVFVVVVDPLRCFCSCSEEQGKSEAWSAILMYLFVAAEKKPYTLITQHLPSTCYVLLLNVFWFFNYLVIKYRFP